jgi:cell filamentation protein
MDEKYKYSYEKENSYCYPDTSILKNKLNIKKDEDLYNAERDIVNIRAAELYNKPISGDFDFKYMKSIHKYLFQDIYEWAGENRTVDIAKSNLFCLARYIDTYAKELFDKINKEKYFIKLNYEDTVEALVNIFADVNALHPFREGNGRTQREFIRYLSRINGIEVDFTLVDSEEMIIASSESVNGSNNKLSEMFKRIAKPISKEEQLEAINLYCSKTLKNKINKLVD